jgi:hypothetical protein
MSLPLDTSSEGLSLGGERQLSSTQPISDEGGVDPVLGYTIIYPTRCRSSASPSCMLNSVLVPAHRRGAHLGQALVTLAVRVARREMGYR